MRVIAGEYKGRKLDAPFGKNVRPTSDKVKEAIFSMLASYIEDSVILDLFSGTGNLGIEGLSRGAKKCYFSDNSRESIKFIKENIEKCKIKEDIKILHGNWKNNLEYIDDSLDIVFVDPPYVSEVYLDVLESLSNKDILSKEALVICESNIRNEFPDKILNLSKFKEKKYGKTKVTIYVRIDDEA